MKHVLHDNGQNLIALSRERPLLAVQAGRSRSNDADRTLACKLLHRRTMERRQLIPKQWQFDQAHSSINFSVRHMVVSKVRGRFTRWTGVLAIDDVDPSMSSAVVEIDATSIDTGEPIRDTHLRADAFLCADRFPRLT